MSTAHSVELGGGDVEPTQHSELRQLWPSLLGKVNWCLSGSFTLNLSLSKVTVDCTGRKGVREAGGTLEMGQGRAQWLKQCQHGLAQGSLPSGLSV